MHNPLRQQAIRKILKWKTENNKVINWSIDLSLYKLNIQYIKGTKIILITVCPDF